MFRMLERNFGNYRFVVYYIVFIVIGLLGAIAVTNYTNKNMVTVDSTFTITEKRVEVFNADISPLESLLFSTDGKDYITDFTNGELTLSVNSPDIYNDLEVGDTVDCVIKYNVEDTTDTKLISYTKVIKLN